MQAEVEGVKSDMRRQAGELAAAMSTLQSQANQLSLQRKQMVQCEAERDSVLKALQQHASWQLELEEEMQGTNATIRDLQAQLNASQVRKGT